MEKYLPDVMLRHRCWLLLLLLLIFIFCLAAAWWPAGPAAAATRKLPQSIIIGARKCCTRALLDFLKVHPQVRAASGEIHYFDDPRKLQLGLDWYRQQMPLSLSDQVTIEKSPAYFITQAAPRLVEAMNPEVKLILIVRDPVTRIISDYAQHIVRRRENGKVPKPLEQIVLKRHSGRVNARAKMVATSLYHRHLRRWLHHFPPSQIHVVDGDQLIRLPHRELHKVEQFLGLSSFVQPQHFVFNDTKGFFCLRRATGSQKCLGREKGRRHPSVHPRTVAKLRKFFAKHDSKLTNLTGTVFSWME